MCKASHKMADNVCIAAILLLKVVDFQTSVVPYGTRRTSQINKPQNLKFHVTAGNIGNNETCLASTFKSPFNGLPV
jgi:hypothetical protein